jgi:hypothetical protein
MPTTLKSFWEVYEALNFYSAFGVGAAPQQAVDQATFSQAGAGSGVGCCRAVLSLHESRLPLLQVTRLAIRPFSGVFSVGMQLRVWTHPWRSWLLLDPPSKLLALPSPADC